MNSSEARINSYINHHTYKLGQNNNVVLRSTVLETQGRVGSVFLRIETSIIKTPSKKYGIFVKKKSRVGRFR